MVGYLLSSAIEEGLDKSGFVLAGGLYQAASCSRSRGSAPSAALGRLEDGAPAPRERLAAMGCLLRAWEALRTEPPLRVSAYAADGRLLRGWGDIGDRAPLRVSAYAVNDEPRGALFSTVPY